MRWHLMKAWTKIQLPLVTEDTTIGINLAAVDMITERFTRHLRLGLLDVLRTSPRITADRVQTLPFSEYLKDLKAPLSVNTVRLSGLRGTSMVVIDPNVIFASLDRGIWSGDRWTTAWQDVHTHGDSHHKHHA